MKNLKKSLICFSICVFILTVCQGQGIQQEEPKTITIKIFVDNGEVKCDPDPAEAHYGDTVIWISDYEFTVDFGKKTPLKMKVLKAKEKAGKKAKKYETDETEGEVTTQEAKLKNKKIRFKYSVEVTYDNKTLKADPDLDIQP